MAFLQNIILIYINNPCQQLFYNSVNKIFLFIFILFECYLYSSIFLFEIFILKLFPYNNQLFLNEVFFIQAKTN